LLEIFRMYFLKVLVFQTVMLSAIFGKQAKAQLFRDMRDFEGESSEVEESEEVFDQRSNTDACDYNLLDPMRSCPMTNYPTFIALVQARSPDQALQTVKQTSPRAYCRDGVAFMKCAYATIQRIPSQCGGPFEQARSMLPYFAKVIKLAEKVCRDDIRTIEANWNCFTKVQRFQDSSTCGRGVQGPGGEPCKQTLDYANCIAKKVGEDRDCTRTAEVLIKRVSKEVYQIFKPFCDQQIRRPSISNYLDFLNIF